MKTLRAWFVAYGVGGPVLFLTQQSFADAIVASGYSKTIGILFLLGVLFQVLIALLNKWVSWGLYYYEDNPDALRRNTHDFCESISGMVWIDIVADVATLVLFAFATATVFVVVSQAAGAS
jgi:uncharacterized protein involved in cysteine biosynthesis